MTNNIILNEGITPESTKELNLWEQLIGIILRPKEVFAFLKSKTALLVPIIMMIIGTAYESIAGVLSQKGNSTAELQELLKTVPPEEAAQIEKIANAVTSPGGIAVMVLLAILGVFIVWLIKAGILHVISKIFGGKGSFVQSLNIVGIAWIAFFGQAIFQGTYTLATGEIAVNGTGLLDAFLATTDLFVIWNMVLLVIGFSFIHEISKGKAAVGVVGIWVIGLLLAIGGVMLGQSLGEFNPSLIEAE